MKEKNGKITAEEMHSVEKRAGVVASTVLAEVQHFHSYRIKDFKASLQAYLQSQIQFHREVSSVEFMVLLIYFQQVHCK